jgi:hypothetical protein
LHGKNRSKDDKIFAGIGIKFRIDVGGRVVDVNIGRLVERVCVLVVGCVFVFTRACVVSLFSPGAVVAVVVDVDDADEFDEFEFCVDCTGTEIFALMMCTSAFG